MSQAVEVELEGGGQSWSLPRITGGRWDCEREEYSLQGKSYLARVAVGLEPGASSGGRIDGTCRGCLRDLQESTRTKVTRRPS